MWVGSATLSSLFGSHTPRIPKHDSCITCLCKDPKLNSGSFSGSDSIEIHVRLSNSVFGLDSCNTFLLYLDVDSAKIDRQLAFL